MGKGKVYLNYYSNLKNTEEGLLCRVSRGIPKGIKVDKEFEGLYPSALLLEFFKDGKINWTTYVEHYVELISREESIKEIAEIEDLLDRGISVNLLCYEERMPCHRFILGQLFLAKGYEVKVWRMNAHFQASWMDYSDGSCFSSVIIG